MSYTQDMGMIPPAISFEICKGEIFVFAKQNNFKVLNPACVKVTADTYKRQQ